MRVLQINAVYERFSTGRNMKEMHEYMLEHGIESYIASPKLNGLSENAYKIGNNTDMKLHALMSRITGKQAYFSKQSTKGLLKYIDRIKPDIIQLHNLHGNYINLNMILEYIAKKNIASVIILHDCWFITGKCTHYTVDECYKWQTGCEKCKRLKRDNQSWFFDRTAKMWADKKKGFESISRLAVIGVSDWITNEAKKSYLKNAAIIKRIYNWIDLDVFYPRNDSVKDKYNIPADKFIILCVGAGWQLHSPKFSDIIKLSDMIDDTMHIVVVGKGLENETLPDNITKIDYLENTNELAKIYSCADVYVHVSREDTFGKVVAEAMACGTPAIVYNSTGLPELIGKSCGYVVPCNDVNAIYENLKVVQENGKNFYTGNCIEFVRNNFEKNKLINETVKTYKDLIKIDYKSVDIK